MVSAVTPFEEACGGCRCRLGSVHIERYLGSVVGHRMVCPSTENRSRSGASPGSAPPDVGDDCVLVFVLKAELTVSSDHTIVIIVDFSPDRDGHVLGEGYNVRIRPRIAVGRERNGLPELAGHQIDIIRKIPGLVIGKRAAPRRAQSHLVDVRSNATGYTGCRSVASPDLKKLDRVNVLVEVVCVDSIRAPNGP